MSTYKKLSDQLTPSGEANFIANKTKRDYINLRGVNPLEVQDSVIEFMINYDIWQKSDKLEKKNKPLNFRPQTYHDISFVMRFYKMGCQSKEKRDREKEKKDLKEK